MYLNIFVILVSYYSDKIHVCFLESWIVDFKFINCALDKQGMFKRLDNPFILKTFYSKSFDKGGNVTNLLNSASPFTSAENEDIETTGKHTKPLNHRPGSAVFKQIFFLTIIWNENCQLNIGIRKYWGSSEISNNIQCVFWN